jgi:hypothetical protein
LEETVNPNQALDPSVFNRKFADALEFVDQVIAKREHMIMSPWRTLIPRGTYTLGEGLVKKSWKFYPGIGDQRGLAKWRPIQISRIAAGDDPGVNACSTNPYTVRYGLETVNYTGFKTERETEFICINDIRFTWQFKQQLALIMGFLGDISVSVWENYAREQYIKMAVDAGNGFVLAGGNPRQYTLAYDPFAEDGGGDKTITIDRGLPVSTLNWGPMRWISRYLGNQAPQAALGQANGRPQFGLVMDLEDFDLMVAMDPQLREDYRYAAPEMNIANYGTVQAFKGFSLMDDPAAPRFRIKSSTATELTLKRIDPLVEEDTQIGKKVSANPDYLNAEYGMIIVLMKDVFQIEIPPAGPSSPGGGTSFGATPGLNGDFRWLNIQDRKENRLNELGQYFARYEAFAKPLTYADDAMVLLYRRCPAILSAACAVPATAAAAATLVHVASTTAFVHVAGSSIMADVTLASPIPVEAGAEVTVTNDSAATSAAVVAESSNAPTYRLVWLAGARPAEADMNDTAVAGVTPA